MRPKASAEIARDRLIFVVMTVAVCMVATEARRFRRPDYCDQKTRQSSFLWKVQTKPPSYFFGTIHVPFNRVWEHVPENVKRAFHLADAVFFELDLTDASTVSALTRCQRLPRGARLRQLLPADMYRRLQKHLDYVRHMMPLWMSADQRGRGLYADYLFNAITGDWQQKRPVWVMLMVNTLTESGVRSRGVPVLDLYLALEAEKRNKRTGAVERVEEQCLPLNGLNISQVVFALNQTLSQHENMRAGGGAPAYTTDDLIHHYNCGDLDEVIFRRDSAQIPPSVFQVPPLQSAATAAASAASAAQRVTAHSIDAYFREELIYKRNQRMGERILELIWARPGTSYFFAFGAGHFLGNYTVLDVIRRGGYKVTQVGPHEPVRRYKRRRRPGGSETDVSRSRAEEPAPAAQSPGRGQVTARADQLAAASPRAKKYTEHFSDLWVRIDDQSKSRSSISEASDAGMKVLFDWPSPSSGGSAAATVGGASRTLLAVLLLIVMAVSPTRTGASSYCRWMAVTYVLGGAVRCGAVWRGGPEMWC